MWELALAFVIQDATFSVSHYLLACKYNLIAENVPKLIRKESLASQKNKNSLWFWIGLTANIGFPLMKLLLVPLNNEVVI